MNLFKSLLFLERNLIDLAAEKMPQDELALRRLKKRRLMLRDQIAVLEAQLGPKEPA